MNNMWVCKYRINVVYTEQLTKIRKEKKQGVVEVNTSKISFTRMEILKTRHSTNQDEVEARTTADATVGGGGGHSPRASAAGPARRSRPLHTAVAAAAA